MRLLFALPLLLVACSSQDLPDAPIQQGGPLASGFYYQLATPDYDHLEHLHYGPDDSPEQRAEMREDYRRRLHAGSASTMEVAELLFSDQRPDAETIVQSAKSILSGCDPDWCFIAEQSVALDLLNVYLAKGQMEFVSPEDMTHHAYSESEREAIAYAVRLLDQNQTRHANLMATALEASADLLSKDEKRIIAANTLRQANTYLAESSSKAAAGARQERDRLETNKGIERLRTMNW
jgi:hypothetical protein